MMYADAMFVAEWCSCDERGGAGVVEDGIQGQGAFTVLPLHFNWNTPKDHLSYLIPLNLLFPCHKTIPPKVYNLR